MTRRRLVTLLAFIAAALPLAEAAPAAEAAWRDVLDTPATASPHATRSLLNGLARAGQRVVAAGQRGHILFSDDGGRAWKQAQVPSSSDLTAVTFADDRHGWAVGHDGLVLHSTDAGVTWTRQLDGRQLAKTLLAYADNTQLPPKAAEEAKRFAAQAPDLTLLDVWFRDARNGWAVGAFGLILHTTDGGAHWEPWLHAIDNPNGLHLYAVRGIGADTFVVGEQGLVLKLDADGTRLRALELPYKGTLFGIVGNEHTLVVHGLRGSALRSTDGGRSWQQVDTGLQVGLTAGARTDDGRLVLVSQAGHVLSSRDDGATFTPAKIATPMPAAGVVATKNSLVIAGPRGVTAVALP